MNEVIISIENPDIRIARDDTHTLIPLTHGSISTRDPEEDAASLKAKFDALSSEWRKRSHFVFGPNARANLFEQFVIEKLAELYVR